MASRTASEFAEKLASLFESNGAKVVDDPEVRPELVVAVGGDGTMLAAVRRSLGWDVPVVGFNLGTLGFLTEADSSEMAQVVGRLTTEDYDIHERLTVAAAVGGVSAVGVNDVVVEKIDTTRLVNLDVVIDGSRFTTFRADGLVIATPTGSTAYSFSAGGPLVAPGVGGLVLTPVASHSPFDRSLVIPPTSKLEISVARDRAVRVNVDKCDLGEIGEGESVVVKVGDTPAKFVSLGRFSYTDLVRDKFGLD